MHSARQAPHHDPALDGLRGVAVLLVFLFHYGGGLRSHQPAIRLLGYLTQSGWVGVDVFFALSGFLITGLLLADRDAPHALRSFFARRALRILPLYFLTLLLAASAALLAGAHLRALRPLLLYAAFLQNVPALVGTALRTPPPLPVHHLWSLAVEEQFYVLWPFLLLAAARTRHGAPLLCAAIFALSCAFRWLVFAPGWVPFDTAQTFATILPARMGALALGGALACWQGPRTAQPNAANTPPTTDVALLRSAGWMGVVLGALLYVGTTLTQHNLLLNSRAAFRFGLPGVDLLSAGLVALTLTQGLWRRLLALGPIVFLGRLSYGFYVLHILCEPGFDALGTLLTHQRTGFAYQAARLLCAFPLSVLAAWLSFAVLERPFLRWKRRFPHAPALKRARPGVEEAAI